MRTAKFCTPTGNLTSIFTALLTALVLSIGCTSDFDTTPSGSDMVFSSLSAVWDEAVPLGNAKVGALVWQKDDALRMSLDHYDLWDLRPTDELEASNPDYSYVKLRQMIKNGEEERIHRISDVHYSDDPGPSKIPCGAIEFPLDGLGKVTDVHLYLNNALCRVTWDSGAVLETFLQAGEPVGWFVFKNVPEGFKPSLKTPSYDAVVEDDSDSQAGGDIVTLGYTPGPVSEQPGRISYHQKGWGDFFYDIAVRWKETKGTVTGAWSVSTSLNDYTAANVVDEAFQRGVSKDYASHKEWWAAYWAKSTVRVPDKTIQKQYDAEIYKLGAASREDSRPISLQAIWTADNGHLPPWKGDYHHDLNTQLSYWPVYSGNRLSEGLAYLNMLWDQREEYRKYAKEFFGVDGIMVPGVADLYGRPMGGWIQYSLSPTTSAWVGHHFYLHWKYSADDRFLRERAWPFIGEVACALEGVTELKWSEAEGRQIRTLEYSTSPEIYNNTMDAWFKTITNYDLALIRFAFGAAAEMAGHLGLLDQENHWAALRDEMPRFDIDADGALTFAHGFPYNESHRHFSHLMAIHPLGLIDFSQGEEAQKIIKASIAKLDEYGPDWWCGYSYSWCANMKARAFDGEGAAEALKTFAECFVLPNSFHANGDQTKTGKSRFVYRPFTLEGNFAYAAGLQEMLLQSHTGTACVFPAIPASWKDVSFKDLRAMGAFLVSASLENGTLTSASVRSENGGHLSIILPGDSSPREFDTAPGETIDLLK